MHMIFKFALLSQTDWENIAQKFSKCSKMVKFLTLNGNFEGLLSPTELKQSSNETLDYIARLTWNCILKSNWFG